MYSVEDILSNNQIFKNCHQGERCFIIDSGSSLVYQDLTCLKDDICFAVSNVFSHPDYRIFQPTYYCLSPYRLPMSEEKWKTFLSYLNKRVGSSILFFSLSDMFRNLQDNLFEKNQVHFLNLSGAWDQSIYSRIDLTKTLPSVMTDTLMPLMVAIYMGFQKIYLIGCDQAHILKFIHLPGYFINSLKKTEKEIQTGSGYVETYEGSIEEEFTHRACAFGQFRIIREIARNNSIDICNATHGGLLDIFPRVQFESLFNLEPKNKSLTLTNHNDDQTISYDRLEPVSRNFGFDRGLPVDRYYIQEFINQFQKDITGHVLEIGDKYISSAFIHQIKQSDVLSVAQTPDSTIIGNLETGENIPLDTFDCIIMTQVIQFVFDFKAAINHALQALKPGGVLLLTTSGISQISRYDMDRWGEFWRFTDMSLKKLFTDMTLVETLNIQSWGNVTMAKAFLDGLSIEELPEQILNQHDSDYPVLLSARVQKKTLTQHTYKKKMTTLQHNFPPLILLYHRVADDPIDSQLLAVSPAHFEAHLIELKQNYRVLSLNTLLEEIHQNTFIPNSVAITFDDGYLDNLTNALPLLEKYNLPATFFITSGMIQCNKEFWWDAIERVFLQTPIIPSILQITTDEESKEWHLLNHENRLCAYEELSMMLHSKPYTEIEAFMDQLYQWAGIDFKARDSHRILTSDQLKQLALSRCVTIGSHTMTHSRLSSLSSDDQRVEIINSKQQLESMINHSIQIISYPFGMQSDFTNETIDLVQSAGYMAGIANIQGYIEPPVNLFAIPRRLVRNWSSEVFSKWLISKDKNALELETLSKRSQKLYSMRFY